MAGEVLAAGQDARVFLEPAHGRRPHRRDLGRVGAIRAVPDDRVLRVVVHIQHRRKIPVETDRAQTLAHPPRPRARLFRVAHLAHRAGGGVFGIVRRPEPLDAPAFLVHGHEQRRPALRLRPRLKFRNRRPRLVRWPDVAPHQDDAAHGELVNKRGGVGADGAALLGRVAGPPEQEHLADFLVECHGVSVVWGRRVGDRHGEGHRDRLKVHALANDDSEVFQRWRQTGVVWYTNKLFARQSP